MGKKINITAAVLGTFLVVGTAAVLSQKDKIVSHFNVAKEDATACSHEGYHYEEAFPTDSAAGHKEFYICCKCQKTWLTTPEAGEGTFITQEFSKATGGFDNDHVAYLPPLTSAWSATTAANLKEGLKYGYHTINLANDIDFNNAEWNSEEIEAGQSITLNGNNHTLSNMLISDFIHDGSASAGSGGRATYGCGFIGANNGTLVINNLTLDHVTADMNVVRSDSEGSSQVGVVIGVNSGSVTLNDVNVTNSKSYGYTKVGILLGHQMGGTFMANHCALIDTEVGLQVDGESTYPCFSAQIVGYTTNDSILTNGIKLSGNTFAAYPPTMAEDNFDKGPNEDGTEWYFDGSRYYWSYSPTYIKGASSKVESTHFAYTYEDYDYETEEQYLSASNAIARVSGANYTSLDEAFDDANNFDTVTITDDITPTGWVEVKQGDKQFTIDLDGNDITRTNGSIFDVYSKVTIIDSEETGKISAAGRALYLNEGADVTLNNVDVVGTDGSAVNVIGAYGSADEPAKLVVNGGSIESTGEQAIYIDAADHGAEVVINDATVTSSTTAAISFWGNNVENGVKVTVNSGVIEGNGEFALGGNGAMSGANLTINGGEITNNGNGTAVYLPFQGTTTINGGTFTGKEAVVIKSGTVNITGGTFIANGDKFVPTSGAISGYNNTGDCIYVEDNYTVSDYEFTHVIHLTISGGTFTSQNANAVNWLFKPAGKGTTVDVIGGSFSSDPAEYVPSGYTSSLVGDKYVVSKN